MGAELKTILPLIVQASMILVVFAIGLRGRLSYLAYAFRHPGLLARGVFAVNVVVPLVTIGLCLLFPVDRLTAAGLIIMAVSPLAPLVPGKMFKAGADEEFVVGAYVALVLASVVMVPLTVALLSVAFGRDVAAPIPLIASFVGTSILLPLILGVIAGTFWPELAGRASRLLTIVAYVALIPILLLIIVVSASKFGALLGDGTLAVIVLSVSAAMAAGYWLGGPRAEHRLSLAQAAATRHPGMAGLIIHRHYDSPRVMLAVVLFLIVSIVVTGVYQSVLLKRLHASQRIAGGAIA